MLGSIKYKLAYAIPIDKDSNSDVIEYDEAGRFFEELGYMDKPIVLQAVHQLPITLQNTESKEEHYIETAIVHFVKKADLIND